MAAPDEETPVGDDRRQWLMDLTDGVLAGAGMVQGFGEGGASGEVVAVAGLAALVAGAIAVAGHRYVEEGAAYDAQVAIIEAERDRVAADPVAEQTELAAIYRAKGLDEELADQVAAQLSARDPLAAQLDAEYRIDALAQPRPLWRHALAAGSGFALGALVPLVAALAAPRVARGTVTVVVALLAIAAAGALAAPRGRHAAVRAVARAVVVGGLTMALAMGAGGLLDLRQATAEVDLDPFD